MKAGGPNGGGAEAFRGGGYARLEAGEIAVAGGDDGRERQWTLSDQNPARALSPVRQPKAKPCIKSELHELYPN